METSSHILWHAINKHEKKIIYNYENIFKKGHGNIIWPIFVPWLSFEGVPSRSTQSYFHPSTLMSSKALALFAPLLEHQSPLLNNFETFLEKLNATFGDLDKECMSSIKIWSLCQGSHLATIYALKFKQLACDISWGEAMFIN